MPFDGADREWSGDPIGNFQYAHQNGAAVSAISGMTGVRRAIDQMTVKSAANRT
jgi:hypothetical protein